MCSMTMMRIFHCQNEGELNDIYLLHAAQTEKTPQNIGHKHTSRKWLEILYADANAMYNLLVVGCEMCFLQLPLYKLNFKHVRKNHRRGSCEFSITVSALNGSLISIYYYECFACLTRQHMFGVQ